ncbi:hypothetical protein FQA39_LY18133 [Lamprigera yunnana]|nr:hypothetical protein FQA39_LY18133 [Lamprigera yunnana]
MIKIVYLVFYFVGQFQNIVCNDYCSIEGDKCNPRRYRYLLYDVNPPEGFNLRRDVYMRYAIFVHSLQKSSNKNLSKFKLVLPPWTNLYHWKEQQRLHIPWSHFFDLESLQKFAPVIEMHNFFDSDDVMGPQYANLNIDNVYILQHYEDMFKTGQFEDKMEFQKCNKPIRTNFYHYNNITSSNIKCLSFHGHAKDLEYIFKQSAAQTILIDHAEVALHDHFGNSVFWQARRSMRFNKNLQKRALVFREKHLNSSNSHDNTQLPEDWRDEIYKRTAKGGPYVGVHLRRRDYAVARSKDVPNLKNSARQIERTLKKLRLNTVFVATDAPVKEYEELKYLLSNYQVFRYTPDKYDKDGELAIIDQIICSHARIQEEREIMGFPVETTFNRLCGDGDICEKPSMWKIIH